MHPEYYFFFEDIWNIISPAILFLLYFGEIMLLLGDLLKIIIDIGDGIGRLSTLACVLHLGWWAQRPKGFY
jgi:hypothetical protein